MKTFNAFIILLIIVGSLVGFSGQSTTAIPEELQRISVMVHGKGTSKGSGTVVRKGERSYILTAYHVVDGLKKSNGSFENVTVTQICEENGIDVAITQFTTELIRYSKRLDLAVLQVLKTNAFSVGVVFSHDKVRPSLGIPVRHIGCFTGKAGYNSYSEGVISFRHRKEDDGDYMQISSPHYSGSSGGGLFDARGNYIGMVLMRHDSTMGLASSIQDMRYWSRYSGMYWLFENGPYHPSLFEVKIYPLSFD